MFLHNRKLEGIYWTEKHAKQKNHNLFLKKNKKNNNLQIKIENENDFFTFGSPEQKEYIQNKRYENNENINQKWMPKKREYSAVTSSTRPQTGRPTSFKKFGSRPMTSTQSNTNTGGKNITSNNNLITINEDELKILADKCILLLADMKGKPLNEIKTQKCKKEFVPLDKKITKRKVNKLYINCTRFFINILNKFIKKKVFIMIKRLKKHH